MDGSEAASFRPKALRGASADVDAGGRSLSVWSVQALFAVLIVIGFANGIAEKAVRSVEDVGLAGAVFDTFGVSIIVWAGCAAVVGLLVGAPRRDIGSRDLAVAGLACLSFLAPVPAVSWLGIVLIALHLRAAACDATNRAAAALAFALTIPLFWSRLVFMLFSAPVLAMDAWLVALMVGTKPQGNLVPFADGSGAVVLEPGCSSLANLSLALLSASLFLHARQRRWTAANVSWMAFSLLLVLTINVFRIGLIGLYPDHYQLIHGPIGATVAGWLTVAAILLVGYHRIGRHALRSA